MGRRGFAGPVAVLAGAAALAGCAPERAMRVRLDVTGEANAPCAAQVDGRWITMRDFPAFARQWRGREAHLDATIETPFRCIGAAIYELQRVGFRRIGFISEPAPAPNEQQQ